MGFFDRFAARKSPPPSGAASSHNASDPTSPSPAPTGESIGSADSGAPSAPAAPTVSAAATALAAARDHLDQRNLPAALAIYEQVLSGAGDRADVLVTISGDLGSTGHVETIVELIAPRYDAERHGPATGINLLQAYLATRNTTAAQHLLDILFTLQRPELEERLYGFSNALAELIEAENQGQLPPASSGPPIPGAPGASDGPPRGAQSIALVSISRPIWAYGLEPLAGQILPPKSDRLRRVAFAQLAMPGFTNAFARMKEPEEEMGRLARSLPLWLAETFYFSPHYVPVAVVGHVSEARHYALFPGEWTTDNLRQLVDTSSEGVDYVFTGAMRQTAGDTEVLLRVWEVKKFRERKQFTARWSPATAGTELARLHEQIRLFMEWSACPPGQGLSYRVPQSPRAWLDVLGGSLTLFLAEKGLLAPEQLASLQGPLTTAAGLAAGGETAALAWLTARARARRQGVSLGDLEQAPLAQTPLVEQAREVLG